MSNQSYCTVVLPPGVCVWQACHRKPYRRHFIHPLTLHAEVLIFLKKCDMYVFPCNSLLICNLSVEQLRSQMRPYVLLGLIWIQIIC